MKSKILIATHNKAKFKEISTFFDRQPIGVLSLTDVGIDIEVKEDGTTFEENAVLKASKYCELSGLTTLADDSGLEVDALGGKPGIYSARYAGPLATDEERVDLLLSTLNQIEGFNFQAKFKCVVAVARPNGPLLIAEGECEGLIIRKPRGSNGFGYDPIFLIPELDRTMAELDRDEKNILSHRAIACRKIVSKLIKKDTEIFESDN